MALLLVFKKSIPAPLLRLIEVSLVMPHSCTISHSFSVSCQISNSFQKQHIAAPLRPGAVIIRDIADESLPALWLSWHSLVSGITLLVV